MDIDMLMESWVLRKKFEAEIQAAAIGAMFVGRRGKAKQTVSLGDGRSADVLTPEAGLKRMGIRIK